MQTTKDITDQQIHALGKEAVAAGDYAMHDICVRALVADDDLTDQDGNKIAHADMLRADARQICADVIVEAQAMVQS